MGTAALRDPLMPAGLDRNGQVCWWALGTIARANDDLGADSQHLITADVVAEWDDEDWAQLALETPQVGELTAGQQALIIATLWDLERRDLGRLDAWWQR